MDEDRLKHSLAVARKMVSIAKAYNMSEDEIEICFLIGFNHDIGYEFTSIPEEHNIVGGYILKNNGFKYWKEVYYHGEVTKEYESIYLDILNQADMQIDKYGNDVGYDKRLEDIKSRYGNNSRVYLKCYELVEKLRNKYNNLSTNTKKLSYKMI